ncbi:ABC transporter permease [Lutispora sp.]|uniref:ABC transporter permease n=1 Tax=Lutispora sp. TaxID=2828727 RepID=UPI002B1F18D9|nr:iron ABC transporter permease [Lutispora sp.]MEA4961820.1 iron ABC transporter permease [Lutispora sp.]
MRSLLNNLKNNKRVFLKKDTLIYDLIETILIIGVVLSVLIFILGPVAAVLKESFMHKGNPDLKNFQYAFSRGGKLLLNSVFSAGLATALTLIFAVCIAVYGTFSRGLLKKIMPSMLMLTMISPPFVASLAYITLFGRRGLITHKLLGLTINPYGWHGVVLMQALGSISIAALIILGTLKSMDGSLIDASSDLGAGHWHTVKNVVLPAARPGIIAAGFLTFIRCLSDFGTPIIIGGKFNVLATQAYLEVISSSNLPAASAMSVLLLLPALLAFAYYNHSIKSLKLHGGSNTKSQLREASLRLDGPIGFALKLICWLYIGAMLAQYGSILLSAVSYYRGGSIVFTLEYVKAMRYGKLRSFFRSLWYSFVAGITAGLLGNLFAYYTVKRRIWGSKLLDFAASLPYIIPGTFFGIGYILAFRDYPLKLTGTGMIVLLNCIFRQLPTASKAASSVLVGINPDLENGARDLGAPKLLALKDIVFPLLRPAFAVSFINTFTATMTTVGAIIFIISPSAKLATVEMFDTLRNGDYGVGAVIANMIIYSTLIINILFSRFVLKEKSVKGVMSNVSSDKRFGQAL